ncbi:Protein ALP1-like [Acropora cervicornis]|uniref:Protein ALP1-like n=1 Tax=Acropora cervicornis TaxID=6130 RepID=A0AAD9QI27_ACRCE|nr:Protein ALP1-like [Acropora cervicornis]
MALARKRKAVVAFMILELLEDPNDRVKRGKTREWLKERAEKGMFQTIIQLSLQDTPAFKEMMRMSRIMPSSEQEWLQIAKQFKDKWNFPNCLGAIDGKHITLQPPPNSGSHYYNYKHTHSIVLLAIAGPDCEALYADVGTNGRVSDGGVWNKCSFLKALEGNKLGIPPSTPLPQGIHPLPYVIVGDNAFALKKFLMKPFPQQNLSVDKRVYNYKLSRARRLSENLFGILINRWRALKNVLLLPPASIEFLVMAALTLHNFLKKGPSRSIYCPPDLVDYEDPRTGTVYPGQWRHDGIL